MDEGRLGEGLAHTDSRFCAGVGVHLLGRKNPRFLGGQGSTGHVESGDGQARVKADAKLHLPLYRL